MTVHGAALGPVLEWASEHRDELMEDWALCSQGQTPKPIEPAEVVPPIRHTVPGRVVSVTPLDGARLQVEFLDGTTGEVDLSRMLASPCVDGTVFEPLRKLDEFAAARVSLGAVCWPQGADLAPDAMYDAIRIHGIWTAEHAA